jgi:hypothetical protein
MTCLTVRASLGLVGRAPGGGPHSVVASEFTTQCVFPFATPASRHPIPIDRIGSSLDDGREVGRLHENPYVPPELRWLWSIIVIGAHQAGIRTNGRTAALEEAKEQFRANYRQWLVWAKLEVES